MTDSTTGDRDERPAAGPLLRPHQTLQDLPVEFRWEVTRRHPYYLQFWEPAHLYRHGLLEEPHEQQFGQSAVFILQGIGVSGDPPPPSSGPEELEMNQLAKAWRGGAVAPLTIRGMAGLLLTDLSQDARRYVGELLLRSAQPASDDRTRTYELLSELMSTENAVLDAAPNRPILSVNVNAPQRAIVEAVEQMVRDWKAQLGISERRRRDELLPEYLSVWDLREGWVGDDYDIGRELSFREISKWLSVPVRTVANRYYSAFRLVCGHDYSFETWVKLFIVVKLNTLLGNQALRRRRAVSTPRQAGANDQVPESFLSTDPTGEGGGIVGGAAAPSIEGADTDLMLDLCGLIKEGFNDEAIVRKLELQDTQDSRLLIQYLRRHQEDSTAG